MSRFMLKGAGDNELAAEIRRRIGAGPNEKVEVATPEFDRPAHFPKPGQPPHTTEQWWALHTMTKKQLLEMGCLNWDGRTMLFPAEWYDHIPKGFIVLDINDTYEKFEPGKTDNDRRFGCLSYGVPATDGVMEEETP